MIKNMLIYLKMLYSKKGSMSTQQILIIILATSGFVLFLFLYMNWSRDSRGIIEVTPDLFEGLS